LVTQVVWTDDITRCFEDLSGGNEFAMREALKTIESRIADLIKKVREPLQKLERGKIINVITIDVHSREAVEKMCIKKI